MFKSLNRGISAPIAIIIIVVCAVLVGGIVIWQYYGMPKEEEEAPGEKLPEDEVTEKEQACLNSGGTLSTSMCCKTTDDFPNLCLIGPCGCSLENSHEVKICDCGSDKCFDGNRCVSIEIPEEPYIEVLSPNGGEEWKIGDTYQIRWKPSDPTEKVTIQLLDLQKRGIYQIVWSKEVSNNGTYFFTIPSDLYPIKYAQLHIKNKLKGFSEGFSIISK